MKDLQTIFDQLSPLLLAYQPPFRSKRNEPGYLDLWSFKDLVIEGRQRKEVFFAAAIIQKSYLGFYYMPVYAEPQVKAFFKPELLACLKGKSCFHIKKVDDILLAQIQTALADGFRLYQERGWV